AAIAKAKEEIETARGVDGYVREAMKNVYGQEEVINTLAGFAQQQVEAKSHAVLLLGGPTGVGKTSGFHAFIEGFNKANGIQSEQPVFEMSLAETTDERLLESALFGSKPPYIGADTPSNLILWLINNPNGGGLLFDEIEKAPPVVLEKLMTFLEKGQVKLTPYLVQSLCKYYENTPKENWPKTLREATNDGANVKAEITLRLTSRHIIGLGTNAGAENYGDSGKGKELKSEQDIAQANKRFTGDLIKKELKARGYKIEVLNRITAFLAFKKLMPKDHVRIVEQRMKDVEAKFASKLINFTFTDDARKFFEKETYDPSAGARNIERQVNEWISRNFNDAILSKSKIAPGDEIVVDVKAGNGSTIASIMKLQKNGESSPLLEYNVGKPLPPSPRELLARAKERLKATLEKRIIGHRGEIKLLTEAIISELSRAVADPMRVGKPVIVYFDGTPGIGKTEIAKAVAEALFDDASRLTRINFNDIIDMNTFYKFGVETMGSAIKTNPESQVMLWDELHRLTDSPYKQMIENSLLSVLDEGEIPAGPNSQEKIQFPAATIVIATGNMAAKALGPHASSMTNRELLAQFRLFTRHPDAFLDVFAKSFGEAFRSRLGKPLLFSPLTDDEVAILRDRLFAENTKIITSSGIKTMLTDSAKAFFIKEYVPMEGGRWIKNTLKLYVENALVALVVGSEEKYKGAEFSVYWDEGSRQLKVDVKRGSGSDAVEETHVLADVPRTKTDYHPATRERAAWKTSIHEGGHSIVRAVLYGPDSVAEINTFGGGEGGWMEKNFAVEGQDMYSVNWRKRPTSSWSTPAGSPTRSSKRTKRSTSKWPRHCKLTRTCTWTAKRLPTWFAASWCS
ncbi:MAG: ATP-dependent Clp protease ATP-binding subunit, partial [Deltaproteobacteria bacterium]|nr:ATP-dependent Clp protease ATP-binding subunit [Deltaproteobacteria bacterium]